MMGLLALGGPNDATAQILTGEVHATSQNELNDNFQGLNTGAQPSPGTTRDDFISTERVGGSGSLEVGLQQLFARGEVGKSLHLKSSIFDADLYTAAGGVNWRVTSACTGDLTIAYDQHQSDFQQLTVPVANQNTSTTYSGSGLCSVGSGYWTGLELKHQDVTNSAVSQQPANRTEDSVRGHFYYQLPAVTKLGADLGYIERSFPQQFLNVDQIDVGLTFERKLDLKTYLTSQFGISAVTNHPTVAVAGSTSTGTSYDPFLSIDVSYAASAKVKGDLLLSRIVQSADDVVASVVIVETAQLSATWQISPKVVAVETAAYTISNFQAGSPITGLANQSREDDRFRNTMVVTYDLSRLLSLNAQYAYTNQSSTTATRTFVSNAITVGLRVTY